MSWLDRFFRSGVGNILDSGGTRLPTSDTLQFTGDGVVVTHDPTTGVNTATITAGTPFGALRTALRAKIGTVDGQIEFLKGVTTAGDGGGGYFRWSTGTATDDDGTILNENGFGNPATGYWERIFSGPLDVRWFGAVGDGATDSTTAIQRAANAAVNRGLYGPRATGAYHVSSAIALSSNTTVHFEGELKQTTSSTALFTANNKSAIKITRSVLTGPGSILDGQETGLIATSCDDVEVSDCVCTGFGYTPFYAIDCTNARFLRNTQSACAFSGRFRGVDGGAMVGNFVNGTSLAVGTLCTCLFLDSTDGHAFGICKNIRIAENEVRDLPGGVAVQMHSGDHITIVGNTATNCRIGYLVGPFNTADKCHDVTIQANTYVGTDTAGGTGGNSGIGILGDPTFSNSQISVVGNTIRKANKIAAGGGGGLELQWTDGITVEGNTFDECYGAGIAITDNGVTGLTGHGNVIRNADGGANDKVAIRSQASAASTGHLTGTIVDGADYAVRFEGAAKGLRFDFVTKANLAIGTTVNPQHGVVDGQIGYVAGDTTITVSGRVQYVYIANASPTTITSLTGGNDGQELTLIFADANTTIAKGTTFNLAGNQDFHATQAGATLTLLWNATLAQWVELSRSRPAPSSLTYTAGDTTPSVANGGRVTHMRVANSGGTTITNFDDAVGGQLLVLSFADANTTIDRSNAVLAGSASFVSAQFSTLTLVFDSGAALWHEVCRTTNNG